MIPDALLQLVVVRRLLLHHPVDVVNDDLGVSLSTQKRVLLTFAACGDVRERKVDKDRRAEADGRRVSVSDDIRLLNLVRESPSVTLAVCQSKLYLQTGKCISIPTLWRAMRRLALSRQKVLVHPKPRERLTHQLTHQLAALVNCVCRRKGRCLQRPRTKMWPFGRT